MADASNDDPNDQHSDNSSEVKSPIVMKIDAPEAEKSAEEDNKPDSFSSSSFGCLPKRAFGNSFGSTFSSSVSNHRPYGLGVPSSSPMSFSGSRSNSSTFGFMSSFGSNKPNSTTSNSFSNSPKPLLLRPSQLAVGNVESTSNIELSEERKVTTSDSSEADSNCITNSTSKAKNDTGLSEKDEPSSSQNNVTNSQGSLPKFVPLGTTPQQKDENCTVGGSGISSSVSGFVFGQNLHARVAEAVAVETADSTSGRNSEGASTSQAATSNGTSASEMLFTSVIKKDCGSTSNNGEGGAPDTPSKSLSEAAREYEESRAVKRKYEEVAVFTGEEDEANVVQLNCKLFAFDKAAGQWVERGRGTLRLNDKEGSGGVQSRVIMRTTGSLRVVLNTKIWGGMTVERPSPKSVRLTALDATGQIKVFLIMASPKEIDTFHKSLQARVSRHQQSEARGEECEDVPTAFATKRQSLDVQDSGGGVGDA